MKWPEVDKTAAHMCDVLRQAISDMNSYIHVRLVSLLLLVLFSLPITPPANTGTSTLVFLRISTLSPLSAYQCFFTLNLTIYTYHDVTLPLRLFY